LRAWEDLCWSTTIYQRIRSHYGLPFRREGAMAHWNDFRQFLLSSRDHRDEIEDAHLLETVNDFGFSEELSISPFKQALPAALTAWSVQR
jgi:hypothetical protein